MKKTIFCVLLTLALILSLASCNGGGDAVDSGDVDLDTQGKILVVYFTAAEEQDNDARLEPDATVISDGFTVSMQNAANAAGDVAEWLRGLGF